MRRFFVPIFILLVVGLILVSGPRNAQTAENRAAENAPTEDKKDDSSDKSDESSKKEEKEEQDKKDESKKSDAAAKEAAAKAAKKKADKDKDKAKTGAEKADKEKSEAAAKEKAAAAAKEKTGKTEEKPAGKADAKGAAKAEAKKRKTYKVEPKKFKVVVPLDGTFVARKMEEVALRPEVWSEYEIVDVIEHGAKVHKGQRLFKFDSEKIDEAIQDLELEQRVNDLAIAKAEDELPRMEKTLKMEFEDADRANNHAKEDNKRYNEVDRPLAVKSAQFMLKYYKFMLDYEKDELKELEKMYKADDLTEETEEIVLKRQRTQVEFAQFSLDNAKIESDEMLNVYIPRMDVRMKEMLDRTALAKSRAQMALSLDLDRARAELDQRKKMRTKAMDRHRKILGDKELMEIKAPADGIVFYGQCVNGRWSDTPSLINRYKPHNKVMGDSILMTIVESRPLYVTSTVDETKRPEVSDGQKVKVSFPVEGTDRANGKVKTISPIPVSSGKFEITFDVNQEQIPSWVVPGMNSKILVTTYDKADVLAVPKKAVHDDKDDPDKHYVWVVDPDDADAKPEKRFVKLGKRKEDEVEVVKGLKKGQVISLDDEEAKDKEKEKKEE